MKKLTSTLSFSILLIFSLFISSCESGDGVDPDIEENAAEVNSVEHNGNTFTLASNQDYALHSTGNITKQFISGNDTITINIQIPNTNPWPGEYPIYEFENIYNGIDSGVAFQIITHSGLVDYHETKNNSEGTVIIENSNGDLIIKLIDVGLEGLIGDLSTVTTTIKVSRERIPDEYEGSATFPNGSADEAWYGDRNGNYFLCSFNSSVSGDYQFMRLYFYDTMAVGQYNITYSTLEYTDIYPLREKSLFI